jgi:hypothetical protein
MSVVLATAADEGILPLVIGSNSGGTTFSVRYFTLRSYPLTTKWTYPCYLLADPFKTVCYFHSSFGGIADNCDANRYNVISAAASTVYGTAIMAYGGPMGVLSTYVFVYFPFLSSLPLGARDMLWNPFVTKFAILATKYDIPSNWLAAHTLTSPYSAGQEYYNYGYDSYLARSVSAYDISGRIWTVAPMSNMSVAWVAAASANTQSGFVMQPFAIAGKSWDGLTGANPLAPVLKVLALVLSYMMTRHLMASNQVLTVHNGMMAITGCKDGCPILDGGFSDNSCLTPIASSASLISPYRPGYVLSIGASSSMTTVKYLMGTGPLGVFQMSGVNVCPFVVAGVCEMLSKVKDLIVGMLPAWAAKSYKDIASAYLVYKPEFKLMLPYCGDPLTYDLFAGACASDGVCDMWTTILPSKLNAVAFTAEMFNVVFVMAYLAATPVSARFANQYLPSEMWALPYYQEMDQWFPNFDAMAPQKGGVAFSNIAGNPFMDFMTYLNIRLVGYLTDTKKAAAKIAAGDDLACNYYKYETVETASYTQPAFLAVQRKIESES